MKLFAVLSRGNGLIGVYGTLELAEKAKEKQYNFEEMSGVMIPSVYIKEVELNK